VWASRRLAIGHLATRLDSAIEKFNHNPDCFAPDSGYRTHADTAIHQIFLIFEMLFWVNYHCFWKEIDKDDKTHGEFNERSTTSEEVTKGDQRCTPFASARRGYPS
jgi:hypothetical protein